MPKKEIEAAIQIQLVAYLELVKNTYKFMFFSSPNEALGKARTGAGIGRMARLKRMGLRSGVADLIFVKEGRVFFLEMKQPKGRQSEHQREFEADCAEHGAPYAVAYSFDEAIAILTAWGILK